MYRYILKRILLLIPVIIGVSFLVFTVMNLAAGDVTTAMGVDEMDPEQLEALRERLGLNDPFLIRYGKYMLGLLRGDLGTSYLTGKPVMESFLEKFPNTMLLAGGATLINLLISLPLGIFSATHRGTFLDNAAMVLALLGLSIPNFWLGLVLIIVFSLNLGWFPSGYNENALLLSLVLPAITLGTSHTASMTRTTRSAMLDVIRQDYLRTARAKGVPERKVINKHALRNALIPVITVAGGQFAGSLGGSVITESVFSWPGVGRLILDSINSRDTPVVVGCIIMKTIVICVILLIIDLLYAYVDPRIKSQYARGKRKKNAE